MKRLIYLLLFTCMATSAIGQAVQPYQRTRSNFLLSDRAMQAQFVLALPGGGTPFFPSYVPDSIKYKCIFVTDGSNLDYPADRYYYDQVTQTWKSFSLLSSSASNARMDSLHNAIFNNPHDWPGFQNFQSGIKVTSNNVQNNSKFVFKNMDGTLEDAGGLAYFYNNAIQWRVPNYFFTTADFRIAPDFNSSFNFNNGNDFSNEPDNRLLVYSPNEGNRAGYLPMSAIPTVGAVGAKQDSLDALKTRDTTNHKVLTFTYGNTLYGSKTQQSNNTNAIAAETTRATNAENANATNISTNSTNITNEVNRAIAAEATKGSKTQQDANTANISTNTGNIANEITRATAAEATKGTLVQQNANVLAISNEVSRATAAESVISGNLTTETNRAIAAEATKGTLTQQNTNASNIAAEITRATNAEGVNATNIAINGTNIGNEITRATNAEGVNATNIVTNTTNLTAETTRATNAEGILTTNLTAEVNRATAAEATKGTLVQQNINTANLSNETNRAIGVENTKGSLTQQNTNTNDIAINAANIVASITILSGKADTGLFVKRTVGVIHLANLSQLQAYSGLATNVFVTDSLRGNSTFNYYPSSAATADSGIVFTAIGKGSGRWSRAYDQADGIKTEWFGAQGNGSADDTNPLQYTINASPTKGAIKLRSVIYKTTGQLTISKSIRMSGGGGNYYVALTDSLFHKNGAIIQSTLSNADFITITAPNCSFEGFALENISPTTPTAGWGINSTNTGGASMNRVTIKGFYNLQHVQQGVSWSFNDMRWIYPVDQGVLIENPTTPDQGDHSISNSSILTNNNTCRPFVFKSSGGLKVTNMKIQPLLGNLTRFPVGVTMSVPAPGTSDIQWNNISIEGWSKSGFDVQGVGGYYLGNITFSNLQIYDVNAAFPITGHAIYLKKLSGVTISNSVLSDNSSTTNTGIQADSVNYLRIGSDVVFVGWANKVNLYGCGSSYQDLGISALSLAISGVLYTTPINFAQSTSGAWSGTLALASQAPYKIFGNFSGSTGTPSFFTPLLGAAPFGGEGTSTKLLHGNASGSFTWSPVSLTADVSGALPFANGGQTTLCSGNLAAQTATVTVCSGTPAVTGTYQCSPYLIITSFTSGTITVTVSYTDIHSVVKTQTFYVNGTTTSAMGAVGTYSLVPITIRPKNGLVSVVATSTGTSTFEVGAAVTQITGF